MLKYKIPQIVTLTQNLTIGEYVAIKKRPRVEAS